jgi:hypothetical protein
MQSIGAHKGMVFSTAPFQSGAREYAQAHRIALIHVLDSGRVYVNKAAGSDRHGQPVPAPFVALADGEAYSPLDTDYAHRTLRLQLFDRD